MYAQLDISNALVVTVLKIDLYVTKNIIVNGARTNEIVVSSGK